MNILVIATYDSFLKTGINLAKSIPNSKIKIIVHVIRQQQISNRQLQEYGLCDADISFESVDEFLHENNVAIYDIVILSVGNSLFKKVFKIIRKAGKIIIVGLFPGVIFGDVRSLTSRINSDVLLCNSKKDFLIARELSEVFYSNVKILNYGLINLNTHFLKQKNHKKNIYFIDQVKIPESFSERMYILEQLLKIAKDYPELNFFIKRRILDKEETVHQNKYDYVRLLENFHDVPENFRVKYEPINESFSHMDMCLSISSTVVMEALYYGIPSYVISDFGIEPKLANEAFLGSNILVSFNQLQKNIINMFICQCSSEWKESNISFNTSDRDSLNFTRLIGEIKKNKENQNGTKEKEILFARIAPEFKVKKPFYMRFIKKFYKFCRTPKQFFIDSKFFNS